MSPKVRIGLLIIGALAVAAFFHLQSSNIPDPDSFYHIRHAWLYRTTSLIDASFPWAQYSIIRSLGGDLWYGFHIFLIPFTYFGNLAFGIKAAGIFMTAGLILASAWAAWRHQFYLAFFWPIFLLLAVPNALFQLVMVRPHVISLALSILLFSFLIRGSWWSVLLLSAGITFFHISFFWMPIVVAGAVVSAYLLCRFFWRSETFTGKSFESISGSLIKWLSVFIGIVAGGLFRPEALATLKLAYIQVFQLLMERQADLPLLFGRELAPISLAVAAKTSILFLLIWIPALAAGFWSIFPPGRFGQKVSADNRLFLIGSGLLSLVFFAMSIFIARRAYPLWVPFGSLFIGAVYSYSIWKKSTKDVLAGIIVIVFLIMIPSSLYRHGANVATQAVPQDAFRESAEWLKNNSNDGDIVFNAHWDNFPPLFFRNQKNYYIGGMDPIFQYAYDPALYWKFHHISSDEYGDLTCGELECRPDNSEDIYLVLKNDFRARYVFIEPKRNPNFYRWLELDNRFERKFDGNRESIFLVK